MGKGTFFLAHTTDNNPEERNRGITITTTTKQFITPGKKRKITMVDSPGHRDFINNMITGASQCNSAILVVSAVDSEYLAGMHPDGQTMEHGLLVTAMGVKNIIVAINKMDAEKVDWSEEKYNNYIKEVGSRLKKIGAKNVQFCPISGFAGLNITEPYDKIKSWYKGKCLMDLIDEFPIIEHDLSHPFRMAVSGQLKVSGVGQIYTGKVYTGMVKPGDNVEVEPSVKCTATIKTIEKFHKPATVAYPDDNVGLSLKGMTPSTAVLKKGDIMGTKGSGVEGTKRFEGFFIVTGNVGTKADSGPSVGFKPVIACATAKCSSTIVEIKSIKARSSVTKKDAEMLSERQYVRKGDKVTAHFQPDAGKMVIESDTKYGILTRFVLRNSNKTIGLGQCKKVLNKDYIENYMAPKKAEAKKSKEKKK